MSNWKTLSQSNKYEINVFGEIRNKRTKRITKHFADKDGYFKVVLYIDNKIKNLKYIKIIFIE